MIPKILIDSFVIFLFPQVVKLFPIAMRFSAEILSSRWIPVSDWVLGIRNLFLIILLNYLLHEIQLISSSFWVIKTSFAVTLLGCIIPMTHIFQFFNISYQNFFLFFSSPRSKHNQKNLRNIFFRIDDFLLCLFRSLGEIQTMRQIV